MTLDAFLARPAPVIHVVLCTVQGSSPREAGAEMFVSTDAVQGTIGGGQLEYMAIDKAHVMLRNGERQAEMDVPLGPEIGQCCGGRVAVSLRLMDGAARDAVCLAAAQAQDAFPHVYIFGAGHVGRAVARLFHFLPVQAVLIDSRAAELSMVDPTVTTRLSALPEADIHAAPKGSAFIILTHDHALDFLLTAEALSRKDAAYVGLIGSATKRAKFARFCAETTPGADLTALTCPIGATPSRDKRPEVIAAFVVAEVMACLPVPSERPVTPLATKVQTT